MAGWKFISVNFKSVLSFCGRTTTGSGVIRVLTFRLCCGNERLAGEAAVRAGEALQTVCVDSIDVGRREELTRHHLTVGGRWQGISRIRITYTSVRLCWEGL
jgi:hypothetical protein